MNRFGSQPAHRVFNREDASIIHQSSRPRTTDRFASLTRPEEYLYARTNLTVSSDSGDAWALGTESEKRIILRIDPNDESITLKDIMQRIQEIQRQHPDLDVFFDGDEYAVCSRPKEKARAMAEAIEGKKKA